METAAGHRHQTGRCRLIHQQICTPPDNMAVEGAGFGLKGGIKDHDPPNLYF